MQRVFLVVDPRESDAEQTATQLQRIDPGAEVLRASSGEAAVALLEERRISPSLVFLEYNLPGLNGIDTIGALRRTRWLDRVPIAMLTDVIADRLVVNCYRLGACAFLTKPVLNHELREVVRDHGTVARQMSSGTAIPGHVPALPARTAA